MAYKMDAAAVARLDAYFAQIGANLRDKRKRESFAMYAVGLLSDGERKSVEPMAARVCGDEAKACATQHKMLHFVGQAAWDDHAVRRVAAQHAIEAMSVHESVTTWIIDDTGFLKQGNDSVGVQRQYTGSAGKITNCQVGVSLSVATRTEHLPVDFELYLPASWTEDPVRRLKAKIPEQVQFQTKIDLALGMIERAVHDGIPGETILADSGYGESHAFRETVRLHGFDYGVGVHAPMKVWCLDSRERRRGDAIGVQDLGIQLGAGAFRRVTWREGTCAKLSSRFCFRRVKVAQEDGVAPAQHEPLWLMMEWQDGESKPTKFTLTTLRRRMTKKQIVRLIKERWRTERVYEEMKGELGLDHYEGRSFLGWHHHVSVALCCFAFVIAERVRHFPPLGRTGRFLSSAPHRGLSGISRIPSSPFAWKWPVSSPVGCPAVPAATATTPIARSTRSRARVCSKKVCYSSAKGVLARSSRSGADADWQLGRSGRVHVPSRILQSAGRLRLRHDVRPPRPRQA